MASLVVSTAQPFYNLPIFTFQILLPDFEVDVLATPGKRPATLISLSLRDTAFALCSTQRLCDC